MSLPRQSRAALALGLSTVAVISLLDVASRSQSAVFAGLLALGPFVTASLTGPAHTAIVAAVAVAATIVLGAANGIFGTFNHWLELVVVVVASLLAITVTNQRESTQRSLTTMRRIALTVQRAIIPPLPEVVAGVRIAAFYESATAEALIGGDFYEVEDTPHGLRVLLGDVRGKGLPAVRLATKAVGSFATAAHLEPALPGLVKAMETSLHSHLGDEEFITAVVAEFSGDSTVTVANCGHHPPLCLAQGSVQPLSPPAETLPLGFRDEPVAARFPLPPGARLLLYTDGLVEARDKRGRMFPLVAVCREIPPEATPHEVVQRLFRDLRRHTGGELGDDVAILVAQPLAASRENDHRAP